MWGTSAQFEGITRTHTGPTPPGRPRNGFKCSFVDFHTQVTCVQHRQSSNTIRHPIKLYPQVMGHLWGTRAQFGVLTRRHTRPIPLVRPQNGLLCGYYVDFHTQVTCVHHRYSGNTPRHPLKLYQQFVGHLWGSHAQFEDIALSRGEKIKKITSSCKLGYFCDLQ